MCEITKQMNTIVDPDNPTHKLISLLAQLIDREISHANNNNKSSFHEIARQLQDTNEAIKKLEASTQGRLDDQAEDIDKLGHETKCPFDMNLRFNKFKTEISNNIADINANIDIIKVFKKYKWLFLLAFLGICSLLGLGARDVLDVIKTLK